MNPESLRILIIGLNYAPEPTGNAPYTSKLAEGLTAAGHKVNVITGYPHYPEWRVAQGYRGLRMEERIRGVSVRRLRHYMSSRPHGLARLLIEASFGAHVLVQRWPNSDVVLVVSPALFSSALVALRSRLAKTPTGIWIQDVYSRGMEETAGGSSPVTRLMKHCEGRILRLCGNVTVIHERFRSFVVEELGLPRNRVGVIRNWTHVDHHEEFDRVEARKKLGWGDDEIIALHAGNMGVKQGLENVVEAGREADRTNSHVRFVLLGQGSRRQSLEALASGVNRVHFLDPLPDLEYSSALRAADVLLVNELPEVREMSVPSKLTSYFSTGVPIVAATNEESATADEIAVSGAGLRVDPGKPAALLAAIEEVARDRQLHARLSAAGRPYALENLTAATAVGEYADWLKTIAAAK